VDKDTEKNFLLEDKELIRMQEQEKVRQLLSQEKN